MSASARQDKESPSKKSAECPACGADQWGRRYVRNRDLTVLACGRCGLHLNPSAPTAEEAVAQGIFEGTFHSDYARDASRKLFSSEMRVRLLEGIIRPRKLLDVGCSLGYLIEAAAGRGWEAWGVDLSRQAVEGCRARGLQVFAGDMRHLPFDDESFEVIYLKHVLEHDPEPYTCLKELGRVLRPGGLLVLEVPSVDCWQVRLRGGRYRKFWKPCHHFWFSRRSIRAILRRAGLEETRPPLWSSSYFHGSLRATMSFLGWRCHWGAKRALGLANCDYSIWRKPAPNTPSDA